VLIEPDRNELGDKRLDPKENNAKLTEDCLTQASQFKIGQQAELEDPKRALGPRLQYTDFISRLKRIIPSLKAVDGSLGNIALYFPRNAKEIEAAQLEWEWGKDIFFLHHKYVGGFPKKELAEYSTIDIDSSHLPTKEHRGWRTVLITLLKQGVVTYHTITKEFGDVGSDQRGWRWLMYTRKWRNEPHSVFTSTELN
jgi:hypothetical protein